MKIRKFFTYLLVFFVIGYASAQEDLLNQLDNGIPKDKQVVTSIFKGLQIANMQSTKLASKGETYIIIAHRFGDLTKGFDNFFGLDNAYTKIGGIYGLTNWLSLGLSRQTYNKTYELTVKYKFTNQEVDGFPFTIVGYNTMDINTKLSKDSYPNIRLSDRLAYTSQLPISRKFSDSFSFEVTPIYVHKNLYDLSPGMEKKDQLVLGAGGRYKLTKRLSLNLEYAARINAPENTLYHNPLSLGLDLETGGHVFQMVFSNSQPLNDVAVFTNATGKWNGGSIYFGFNMYRVF